MLTIINKVLATSALLLFPVLAWSGADRSATPPATVASAKTEVLDQKKIHGEYNDGNFESVINSIEAFMRRNKTYSRLDSVFIAKHLAVVYSANPATREKGKYYMNRLLELLPSAKLVDMYVSDEIDRIFDKVREEFLSRQKSFGVDQSMVNVPEKAPRNTDDAGNTGNTSSTLAGTANPPVETKSGKTLKKSGASNAGIWIAAGTGVVAVGLISYYFVTVNDKAPDKTYVVP